MRIDQGLNIVAFHEKAGWSQHQLSTSDPEGRSWVRIVCQELTFGAEENSTQACLRLINTSIL
jgi:hypothetical protein